MKLSWDRVLWCSVVLLLLAILVLWLMYPWLVLRYAVTTEAYAAAGKLGPFGDIYGGLNSLFTALAFFALVITVILQSRELHLQRDELRGQKEGACPFRNWIF